MLLLLIAAIGTSFGLVREHYALQIAENNREIAHKASEEAAEQAKLALAAKADADQQAKIAKKAALLADARYLTQQGELPDAANKLREADQYDLKPESRWPRTGC